jgi:hypothetical protein
MRNSILSHFTKIHKCLIVYFNLWQSMPCSNINVIKFKLIQFTQFTWTTFRSPESNGALSVGEFSVNYQHMNATVTNVYNTTINTITFIF